jgi:hypothetical protein
MLKDDLKICQERIACMQRFISFGSYGENDVINQQTGLFTFLIEMKVQIDRWNNITEYFCFHSSREKEILSKLNLLLDQETSRPMLWGAVIIFTDDLAENQVIAFGNEKKENGRDICVGYLQETSFLDTFNHITKHGG